MLTILGPRSGTRFCDGVSRRSFLRIGALGMGGLALPQLLEAEAKAIELAVEKTIAEGIRTADIAGGGKAVGTKAMGAAILARL